MRGRLFLICPPTIRHPRGDAQASLKQRGSGNARLKAAFKIKAGCPLKAGMTTA
jgi:hypothetical protein